MIFSIFSDIAEMWHVHAVTDMQEFINGVAGMIRWGVFSPHVLSDQSLYMSWYQ